MPSERDLTLADVVRELDANLLLLRSALWRLTEAGIAQDRVTGVNAVLDQVLAAVAALRREGADAFGGVSAGVRRPQGVEHRVLVPPSDALSVGIMIRADRRRA